MKVFMFLLISVFSFVSFGQEVPAVVDPIADFIAEWYWVVGGIILVVEYLIGISKIPVNSTIELVLSIFKMIKPKK